MKAALVLLTLVAATAFLAVARSAVGGDEHRASSSTRVFHARTTSLVTVDNARPGVSAGDLFTFTHALTERGATKRSGQTQGYCARVGARVSECTMTTRLADGQVVVAGSFLERGRSRLPIAGGTGAYADERGWVDVRRTGLLEFDLEFTLRSG